MHSESLSGLKTLWTNGQTQYTINHFENATAK